MSMVLLPPLLLILSTALLGVALLVMGRMIGPRRSSAVKQMPYESGMDPIHEARRRFDVRFHLMAVAFLIFDVELLFLYPWAVANKWVVANKDRADLPAAVVAYLNPGNFNLIFAEVVVFVGLLAVGFAYAWRKGVFRW